jgi:heparin binding hemagglutinin HbhA
MTLVSEIRKSVIDTTPVYAAVGVTDLAVEMVRDARVRAAAARADFDASALQDKAVKRAEKVAEQVAEQAQHLPARALNQTLEAAGKAHTTYAELAVRGEKLVKRIRAQKATQELIAQAGSTVALGKGAVTTVRKSAAATRLSTKRTATIAKKTTASAKRATKAVATSARTTATTAKKAVKTAAPKVGD